MITREHPARYTPSILNLFEDLAEEYGLGFGSVILDPCAGTGERLHHLAQWRGWQLILIELEDGLSSQLVQIRGDSTRIPIRSGVADGAMTSITYGNRLQDKGLRMKDPTGRLTYDLANGKPLHPSNTGGYGVQRGYETYLSLNERIFAETFRVLKPDTPFFLNSSNCIHRGVEISVTVDNVARAVSVGFKVVREVKVQTPRYRNGQNGSVRVEGEDVVVLWKP